MTASGNRDQWQPPPRPEWVRRLNEEGDCMNISGVVPLDENSLLAAAMRATGLADFGADDWREPFRVFIKSLEEDARLNLTGRIRLRSEVLQMLEARLQIEDTYKRHPEIEDEQIVQPIMVVGQGRSGTSFLINTLAANPDNGALLQWETMFPCPPPEQATYRTDPRIAQADLRVKQVNRVTPTMAAMHEWKGDLPQECNVIMAINFIAPAWLTLIAQVSSYAAYIATQDVTLGIRYHQRILKLLQWKNPRQRWVLKDVNGLDNLAAILKVYPDACFVWPHRDPVRALASGVNLVGTFQWGYSDHPFIGDSFAFVTDPQYSAQRLNAVIDTLDRGVVPPRQIYHMLYQDLVGGTMTALDAMYRHFGIALSDGGRQGMAQYLADNPRTARPAHTVAMSDAAVTRARDAYARYQKHFNIPNE
jgi:Sulfotransferase family